MRFIFLFLITLFMASHAEAYSYSAAGKEPLMDGRNGIVGGLKANDAAKVEKYFNLMRDDVEFLGRKYDKTLLTDFEKAINGQNKDAILKGIQRLFAAEIQRRLSIASRNLDKYQNAKVMVVKSTRFFEMIEPELPKSVANAAQKALQGCLAALGKPGMFGAGQVLADPKAYDQSYQALVKAFAQ